MNRHLKNLVAQKALVPTGKTKGRAYKLASLVEWSEIFSLTSSLAEDVVWRQISPLLGDLPENVLNLWQYGFTEMLNNVIDHSGGASVTVRLERTAAAIEIVIVDDGVGIFHKIQAALGLIDERHAVLELAKGKFTTDPARHTGEGIFFTSRSFDSFQILSGGVYFDHSLADDEDWILERNNPQSGTLVAMRLLNHTSRTLKSVLDAYSDEDFTFSKTVVPVRLAKYGDENLISRSQAKRLLARVDRFRTVLLDFDEVETVGHSFADEIFRVFQQAHPDVRLIEVNASESVVAMIERARVMRG